MGQSKLRFAALTDVGQQREHNEDNYLVDRKMQLFVVCDGMGGHAAGEVASAMAVRTFHEELKREWDLVEDYRAEKTGASKVSKRDLHNVLEFAVNRASSKVHSAGAADEGKRGMGTTLVAALVIGHEAFIAHVGDSRLYLLRDGVLQQVTEDHNVYNELVKRKKMSREKADKLAQKNAITRAVGVYEHAQADTLVLDLLAGDRILLCSDGLSMYFEDDLEGLSTVLRLTDETASVRGLIDAANAQGGKDNITAIIITVGDPEDRDEDRARRLALKRELLSRMPLFRPLSEREILRVLQVTDVQKYDDEQVVMAEGDTGEELFIVLNGALLVTRGDQELATLTQGSHVGEMALIRSQPRSATVISSGETELMVIRRRDFYEILRKEHELAVKLLWQFLGVLSDRLAATSRELGQAKEVLAIEDVTSEIFPADDDDRTTLVLPPPPPAAADALAADAQAAEPAPSPPQPDVSDGSSPTTSAAPAAAPPPADPPAAAAPVPTSAEAPPPADPPPAGAPPPPPPAPPPPAPPPPAPPPPAPPSPAPPPTTPAPPPAPPAPDPED